VVSSTVEQSAAIAPLKRFLELEGYTCTQSVSVGNINVPLLITASQAGKLRQSIAVDIYPALMDRDAACITHSLQQLYSKRDIQVVLLNDYIVARDLPTAYQQLMEETGRE
jgi:hypothetical protein